MFSYALTLDVDRETVQYVARLLCSERRRRGTRRGTRLLTPFKQALFGLAWLRDRCDVERLGAGFGEPQRLTAHLEEDPIDQPLERVNCEIKRRVDVVQVFPNDDALLRLVTAILFDLHDEWIAFPRHYLPEGSMEELYPTELTISAPSLPHTTDAPSE